MRNVAAVICGLILNTFLNQIVLGKLLVDLSTGAYVTVVILVYVVIFAVMSLHAYSLAKRKFRRPQVWVPLMILQFPTYLLLLSIKPTKTVAEVIKENISSSVQ